MVTNASKKFLVFKAMPDGGDVVISETPPVKIETIRAGCNADAVLPVRLRQNRLLFNTKHYRDAAFQVTLSDINGRVLIRKSFTGNRTGIALPVERFAASAIIANVTGAGGSWNGLFVTTR